MGHQASRHPTRRAERPRRGRARGFGGALGLTALSAVLPGTGLLCVGRRALGLLLLVPALAVVGWLGWELGRDPGKALDVAFDAQRLTVVTTVALVVLLLWVLDVVLTYVLVRPRERSRGQGLLGAAFVLLLCVAVAAPLAVVARYSVVQKDVVQKVFTHNRTVTAPADVTVADPWGGRRRVNVLLLGGDGNVHRPGVRTDSVVLASIDTRTGRTMLFSLPATCSGCRSRSTLRCTRSTPTGSPGRATSPSGCSTRSTATSPRCTRASWVAATTRARTP